jgi:hypothetical protein
MDLVMLMKSELEWRDKFGKVVEELKGIKRRAYCINHQICPNGVELYTFAVKWTSEKELRGSLKRLSDWRKYIIRAHTFFTVRTERDQPLSLDMHP